MMMTQSLSYRKLSGLGLTVDEILGKANNLISTGTSIAEKVQGAVSTFNPPTNTSSNPVVSYQPVTVTSPNNPSPSPQPKSGLSTGAIVGIVAGGLALLSTVVYVATRPSKSVSGLEKVHHKKSKK